MFLLVAITMMCFPKLDHQVYGKVTFQSQTCAVLQLTVCTSKTIFKLITVPIEIIVRDDNLVNRVSGHRRG